MRKLRCRVQMTGGEITQLVGGRALRIQNEAFRLQILGSYHSVARMFGNSE